MHLHFKSSVSNNEIYTVTMRSVVKTCREELRKKW